MKRMNISFSRRMTVFFIVLAAFLLAPIRCFADGAAVTVAVGNDIHAGHEFTVTVGFSSDKEIGRVSAVVSYSDSDLEFIGSDYASGGGGIINISGSPDGSAKDMTIPLVFRALNGGDVQIHVANASVMSPEGKMLGELLEATADVKIEGAPRPTPPAAESLPDDGDPEEQQTEPVSVSVPDESSLSAESSEDDTALDSSIAETIVSAPDSSMIPDDGGLARLKSLSVSAGKLKPDFSPDIFEYEVTVPPDTEYISVDAELKDQYDTIWYEGSEYLGIGMTPWTITVTTPDGTVSHAYYIRITRHTEDYVEPEEESSSEAAAVTDLSSEELEKLTEDSDPLPSVSQTPQQRPEEHTTRERIMPILMIAVCVIIAAVGLIFLRIYLRSKKDYTE